MKKIFSILITLLFTLSPVYAQYMTQWELSQANGNYPTYMGAGSTERGIGFGTVDGKEQVYLISRLSGTNVIILDAANGDSVGTLSTTGVTGGTFALNDAEVSDDGKIFASNLTVNATSSPFKVYRWDSDSGDPVNVINMTGASAARLGDALKVVGSTADNSITIYAAASGTDTVYRFTTVDNGNTFTPEKIVLSNGNTGSVASVTPAGPGETEFYVNAAGKNVVRFDATGNAIDTLSGGIVATGSNHLSYWEDGSKKYLAVFNYGGGNENIRVVDVTGGLKTAKLVFVTAPLGTVGNPNGTGDVAAAIVGNNYYKIIGLSTNNGIASYKTNFLTIAQATEDLNSDLVPDRKGDTVYVKGVVISPNYQTSNRSYYIWDGTAGVATFSGGLNSPDLQLGDMVEVTGSIDHYRGLTELAPLTDTSVVVLSDSNAVPDPIVLTIAQFKANPEAYEGALIAFANLDLVGGTWPASGSATLQMSDGKDTIDVRIDSDTDIDGNPEPTWPRDVIGIGTQFSSGSTVVDNGYQVLPRYYATDFPPANTVPVELTSFSANVVKGSVFLNWKTATETNNSGFEVERSVDNKTFTKIGFVSGHGTTTEPNLILLLTAKPIPAANIIID